MRQRSFRVDRWFGDIGRINLVSGATTRAEHRKRDAMLTELYDTGRLELLRAIKRCDLTINEVFSAQRAGRLGFVANDVKLKRNLWDALDTWEPTSALAAASRVRNATSIRALRRSNVLGPGATIGDLGAVDWAALRARWPTGPTGWNHVRRTVSRFLTMTLQDKWHPFRRAVMGLYPVATEPPAKVPDLPVKVFWAIVRRTPEWLWPSYVTLAATAMRPGEYVRCVATDLLPDTMAVNVPGTKTAASAATVRVDEKLWPWVAGAIPCPVSQGVLAHHWKVACRDAGHPELTLYSLRHAYAQWLADAGQPEARIQHGLRHRTASMTRRYTAMVDKGELARTVGELLFPDPSPSNPSPARSTALSHLRSAGGSA